MNNTGPQPLSEVERETAKKVFKEQYNIDDSVIGKIINDIALLAYSKGVADTTKQIADAAPDWYPELPQPAIALSFLNSSAKYYGSAQMYLYAQAAVGAYADNHSPVETVLRSRAD
jgi:hypothetical protein